MQDATGDATVATDPLSLTADIVSAYVSNNVLPPGDLPGLIFAVHAAVTTAIKKPPAGLKPSERVAPAVAVDSSVFRDHLVCLEDGHNFKSLKRHLRTEHGMTPEDYRAKWGLPPNYPMVAPAYAKARSQLAKNMGLGRARRQVEAAGD